MLSFIDELRDELLATHGDQIKAVRMAQADAQNIDQHQGQLNLDSHSEF